MTHALLWEPGLSSSVRYSLSYGTCKETRHLLRAFHSSYPGLLAPLFPLGPCLALMHNFLQPDIFLGPMSHPHAWIWLSELPRINNRSTDWYELSVYHAPYTVLRISHVKTPLPWKQFNDTGPFIISPFQSITYQSCRPFVCLHSDAFPTLFSTCSVLQGTTFPGSLDC